MTTNVKVEGGFGGGGGGSSMIKKIMIQLGQKI